MCYNVYSENERVPQKNRKEELFMNKVQTAGVIIILIGFLLTLGAVGGIECEVSTWKEFWTIIAHSMPMMGIGVIMTRII